MNNNHMINHSCHAMFTKKSLSQVMKLVNFQLSMSIFNQVQFYPHRDVHDLQFFVVVNAS